MTQTFVDPNPVPPSTLANSDPLIGLSTPSGHIQIRGGAGGATENRLVGATTNVTYQYVAAANAQTVANAMEAAGLT